MKDHILANLVFDDEAFLSQHPAMVARAPQGAVEACGPREAVLEGDVDFTTYLNALSVAKWRTYARVGGIYLHVELKGAACQLFATHLVPDSVEAHRATRPLASVGQSDEWQALDLVVPTPEEAHIVSFAVVCPEGAVRLREGYWFTRVNESDVRPVSLAIATTTFRKEPYVTRNIESIRAELFAKSDEKDERYHLFVVDNGRTLDAEALSDANVTVIPNPNVGGSGGFARGMMAALDAGATHVLLMDDDVRVLPESMRRTHSLLSLARDAYADAFVEGAMLNMEDPNLLFEDVAYVKRDGMYGQVKEPLLVDTVRDVARGEACELEVPRAYGAWWYCCIPTSVVREQGLPLPLFVRCDDVEYGMRCKPKIMAMNGICVWHERFEGRYRSSVDSYQLTRNFLIMAACDALDDKIVRAFMMRFSRTFHIYLRSMGYEACELMLDGLADYLKGPSFIANANGEQILRDNGRKNEVLQDLSELDEEVLAAAKPDPRHLGQGRDRGMVLKTLEMIPHDRHVLPDFLLSKKPAAMYYSRGAYPGRRTMRKRTLVAYDQAATHAHVRTVDRPRWRALRTRYANLMREWRTHRKEIEADYRAALPQLTSRAFWEGYLQKRA